MSETKYKIISEEGIQSLVHNFYARVRRDEKLGPIFERAIAGEWDAHLAKLCDFWSSVMLKTGRYDGQPMRAHATIPEMEPDLFDRWLGLFEQTAREQFAPPVANAFVDRAHRIAQSLKLGLFYRPDRPQRSASTP